MRTWWSYPRERVENGAGFTPLEIGRQEATVARGFQKHPVVSLAFGQTRMYHKESLTGFTLIEYLVVMAVVGVVAAVLTAGFFSFHEERLLEGAAEGILSTLEQARSLTLSSREQMVYGVHLQADRYVLFEGPTFNASAPTNKVTVISSAVEIFSWSLNGGGDDIIFARLSGKTTQDGTAILRLKNRPSRTVTITILSTGIVSRD